MVFGNICISISGQNPEQRIIEIVLIFLTASLNCLFLCTYCINWSNKSVYLTKKLCSLCIHTVRIILFARVSGFIFLTNVCYMREYAVFRLHKCVRLAKLLHCMCIKSYILLIILDRSRILSYSISTTCSFTYSRELFFISIEPNNIKLHILFGYILVL